MKIAVIGLGYVGLPLALSLGKKFEVVGFDIDQERIENLQSGFDANSEFSKQEIYDSVKIKFSYDISDISDCDTYIICVPTDIDSNQKPDLFPLKSATAMVAKILTDGDLVVYESTVWPGCLREICVPILERYGKKLNENFLLGYSPERINPGDKYHTLETITKVISGSNPEAIDKMMQLYGSIITAGLHIAPSIEVAEAAKCIENAQRDINIAFINEVKMLFDKIGINTYEVLKAASTKWNFLDFRPGLVGGHCIGVDPYYLAHKAQMVGFDPAIILSGRTTNDGMAFYYAKKILKICKENKINKIAILGVTFKPNVTDIRNSKVFDIIEFLDREIEISIYDPLLATRDYEALPKKYAKMGIPLYQDLTDDIGAVVLAVNHDEFVGYKVKIGCKIIDMCNVFKEDCKDIFSI